MIVLRCMDREHKPMPALPFISIEIAKTVGEKLARSGDYRVVRIETEDSIIYWNVIHSAWVEKMKSDHHAKVFS